jgi:hypothetical protein
VQAFGNPGRAPRKPLLPPGYDQGQAPGATPPVRMWGQGARGVAPGMFGSDREAAMGAPRGELYAPAVRDRSPGNGRK